MITAKINCSAIEKSRLFKGEKGTYLDVVLIETPNDKFGNDYMVVQGVSKEERQNGVKGAILGNAKSWSRPAAATPKQGSAGAPSKPAENLDSDIPF